MTNHFNIRPAEQADASLIMDMIVELAVYEKARDQVHTSVEELSLTLFGPDPKAHALICSRDDQVIGYAVYFYNYSTWLGKNGIYLEDVYVRPEFRGQGAGKALLAYIANIAVQQKCGRFEWSVLNWNKPSIDFYESLGARPQSEWMVYRLTGEALVKLANKA